MSKPIQSEPQPQPQPPAPAPETEAPKPEAPRPSHYKVTIPQPEGDSASSVCVAVNGKVYAVSYDKEVIVPLCVLGTLQCARSVITRKNKDGFDEAVEKPRFMVMVHGPA